jgi:ribonuclease HI
LTKKQKYYVVWEGNLPGIYTSWEECQKQITGYKSPKYKAFQTLAEAEFAKNSKYTNFVKQSVKSSQSKGLQPASGIIADSICVDAACSGNPGLMEYQGVETHTKRPIFHQGPFKDGTNNIGEFLGLVHALAWLQKNQNGHTVVYTDSKTAISWVKNKKAKTKLDQTRNNAILFELIERAEKWLKLNQYTNQIVKWNTESWGEIPADFGRK